VKRFVVLLLVTVLVLGVSAAFAEEQGQVKPRETKYYAGITSSSFSGGITIGMDLSKTSAVEGVIGMWGDVTEIGARGIYKFQRTPGYDVFGLVEIANWHYSPTGENATGISLGIGLDYNLQVYSPQAPPIYTRLGIGFGHADISGYSFPGTWFYGGIVFRF